MKKKKQDVSIDSTLIALFKVAPIAAGFISVCWGVQAHLESQFGSAKDVATNRSEIDRIKLSYAPISLYHEQQRQIDEIKSNVEKGFRQLSEQLEKNNSELKIYSDRNRSWVQTELQDFKEWLKTERLANKKF